MNTITKDLGAVTAYAVAVANGYTGTEAEWAQQLAGASQSASTAQQQAAAAASSATAANTAKTAAQAAQSAAEAAAATASAAYGTDLIADNYSASKTYNIGDLVIYDGGLYQCKTKISTAEAWTAAHWTKVNLSTEVSGLKSALDTGADFKPIEFTYFNKYIGTSNSTISFTPESYGGTGYKCVIVDCNAGDKFTINGTGAGSTSGPARLWAFAKADGTRLTFAAGGITGNNLVIVAPDGAEKLVINNRINDAACFYGESVAVRMSTLENTLGSAFAAPFDATKTYAAGEYVTYDNKLYRCLCDIATAAAWTRTDWLQVDAGTEFANLQRGLINYISPETDGAVSGTYGSAISAVASGERFVLSGTTSSSSTPICFIMLGPKIRANTNASSTIPKELQLQEGHTYQAKLKYISGTIATGTVSVMWRAGGTNTTIGNYVGGSGADGYANVTYSKPIYADGIFPVIVVARSSGITLTDYTVELTIRDVTSELQIASVEASVAFGNHSIGDIFWVDGILYKATAAIAAGETITPGTNVSTTTIAAELSALKALIVNN